jgi:hypothetical protein
LGEGKAREEYAKMALKSYNHCCHGIETLYWEEVVVAPSNWKESAMAMFFGPKKKMEIRFHEREPLIERIREDFMAAAGKAGVPLDYLRGLVVSRQEYIMEDHRF